MIDLIDGRGGGDEGGSSSDVPRRAVLHMRSGVGRWEAWRSSSNHACDAAGQPWEGGSGSVGRADNQFDTSDNLNAQNISLVF